ncbi:MAG: LOG family protein [Nocardioidaceae bacterium]
MRGWRVQSVDLRDRSRVLSTLDPRGAIFLGVALDDVTAADLRRRGALLFPLVPALPFDPYRIKLYTPGDLYAGIDAEQYERTPDARIYAWNQRTGRRHDVADTLFAAMHDHAVDDALDEALRDGLGSSAGLVGVMGGHATLRDQPAYGFAARLGHALGAAGFTVATGGGPGAMEAANLGAYLADEAPDMVDTAVTALAAVPDFAPDITAWARLGLAVLGAHPGGRATLGVPTWFYGHEPPNVFASAIAKYFQNAIREAVLLARCDGGIVFLPGVGGTVQEVFQAACENYYADEDHVAPMVLVGRRYWMHELPAWPLLTSLAVGHPMADRLVCVDTIDEVLEALC